MEPKMIGLSLSLCISDILREQVAEKDVKMMICGTKASNLQEWQMVLRTYANTYWRSNPSEGIAIANRLMSAGKIVQPRLEQCEPPNIADGCWAIQIVRK